MLRRIWDVFGGITNTGRITVTGEHNDVLQRRRHLDAVRHRQHQQHRCLLGDLHSAENNISGPGVRILKLLLQAGRSRPSSERPSSAPKATSSPTTSARDRSRSSATARSFRMARLRTSAVWARLASPAAIGSHQQRSHRRFDLCCHRRRIHRSGVQQWYMGWRRLEQLCGSGQHGARASDRPGLCHRRQHQRAALRRSERQRVQRSRALHAQRRRESRWESQRTRLQRTRFNQLRRHIEQVFGFRRTSTMTASPIRWTSTRLA